ncbi:MAG: hypothetical protein LBU22_10480 [Dysgonamonadaceae bacterium]|jgi:alpha-tubulin suppressor-like RCC1 family protein|nr:hypothetical protein [Dysgonamonadaceae bacterium]
MKRKFNFLKVSILSCVLLFSAAAFGQVGFGRPAPVGKINPDSLPLLNPQGYLHLQGIQYVDDTTNRNVGLILPKVSLVDDVVTPEGLPAVEGTVVFTVHDTIVDKTSDAESGGVRVRNATGWSGFLSEMSSLDNYFNFEVYGGVPVRVKKVSAGFDFSLIIGAEDESVYAAGSNVNGKTGAGGNSGTIKTFGMVLAQRTRDISAGYIHALSVNKDGTLWAWGDGAYGKTATSSTTSSGIDYVFPVRINSLDALLKPTNDTIIRVEAGFENSLVLTQQGKVYSFGRNARGVNGNGITTDPGLIPTQVNLGTGIVIKDIALSSASAAAIDETGQVHIWGNSEYGRLGNNATAGTIAQNYVLSLPYPIKLVALGASHGLAVSADGKHLYGWGAAQGWGATSTASGDWQEITTFLNGFDQLTETIVSIAAARFATATAGSITGSATTGGSIVITDQNVYAAGIGSTAAFNDRYGLGFFPGTTLAVYSPAAAVNATRNVAKTGFYPVYDKAIYPGVTFDQASIGVYHSLLKQTLIEEDDGSGGVKTSGSYGYGMGRVNSGQLGAVSIGTTASTGLPIPSMIKR